MLLGCTLAALALSFSLSADDKKDEKIDVKKLIGKWKLKPTKDTLDGVIEFQKDGKLTAIFTFGKEEFKMEGTYKIDGNKLLMVMKDDGKEMKSTLIVTKLTDTELVGTNEKGKEDTFVRIKDK